MSAGPVALTLGRTGLYRITGAYLRSQGIDWTGIDGRNLAVTQVGKPLVRWVSTTGPLNDGSAVEFYKSATNTLYATGAVVGLENDPSRVEPVKQVPAAPSDTGVLSTFRSTFSETRRSVYDPAAPGNPWFYAAITSTGSPVTARDRFNLPDLVRDGPATLPVRVWAVTDFPGSGPQHHFRLVLNGRRLADVRFSGSLYRRIIISFPSSLLRRHRNTLRMALPGDVRNAYDVDSIDVQSVTVSYRRALLATSGGLEAKLPKSGRVAVDRLSSSDVSVWRVAGGEPAKLAGVSVMRAGGGFRAAFGAGEAGHYIVVAGNGSLLPMKVRPVIDTSYLETDKARMVIVSPRGFFQSLQPLVSYHKARGLSVKLADIQDVYDRYGTGVANPSAIAAYLRYARRHLGTAYALLVGADTYDYHGYLHCAPHKCPTNPSGRSIIPSVYVRDATFGWIPSDESLVASRDGAPTMAIGRVPAANAGEVRRWVDRALRFLSDPRHPHSAVFAAGGADPSFSATSDRLAGLLPRDYRRIRAYAHGSPGKGARRTLLAAIGGGARIVNVVSHGNLEQWGAGGPLLSVRDVPRLHDAWPGLFFGWGCQTAYDVDPTDRSLNARLLLGPGGGAVLAIGSTGLDTADPQARLAVTFFVIVVRDWHSVAFGAGRDEQVGELDAPPCAGAGALLDELVYLTRALPLVGTHGKRIDAIDK